MKNAIPPPPSSSGHHHQTTIPAPPATVPADLLADFGGDVHDLAERLVDAGEALKLLAQSMQREAERAKQGCAP